MASQPRALCKHTWPYATDSGPVPLYIDLIADDKNRDFFITNDHYFTSKAGALRTFEEKNGPWSWATHVQYCDASGGVSGCS